MKDNKETLFDLVTGRVSARVERMLLGHSMAIRTLDSAAEEEDRQEVSTSVDSAPREVRPARLSHASQRQLKEKNSLWVLWVVSRWINHSTPCSLSHRTTARSSPRGGPTSQSAGGLRDTTTKSEYRPAEKMTRDPRGDWIPRQDDRSIVRPKDNKPDWSRLEEARVRPFATRLPPMGEKVDPNTSHGRFLTGLLEKMEERERRSQQGSLTDTDSVRSYRLSYSEKPKRLTKLGFPFREDDESPASGGLDEVERLRKELRDARTTINRLQEDGYTSSASSYVKRDERPRYRRERAPEVKTSKSRNSMVKTLQVFDLPSWSARSSCDGTKNRPRHSSSARVKAPHVTFSCRCPKTLL